VAAYAEQAPHAPDLPSALRLARPIALAFAASFTCAGVAWSLGGDMTLVIVALIAGWMLGSIGIATVPRKSNRWRALGIVVLLLLFIGEGGFLYWHFLPSSLSDLDWISARRSILPRIGCESNLNSSDSIECRWRRAVFRHSHMVGAER
jgi:hypothetical protein